MMCVYRCQICEIPRASSTAPSQKMCPLCTFLNDMSASTCDICGGRLVSPRQPAQSSSSSSSSAVFASPQKEPLNASSTAAARAAGGLRCETIGDLRQEQQSSNSSGVPSLQHCDKASLSATLRANDDPCAPRQFHDTAHDHRAMKGTNALPACDSSASRLIHYSPPSPLSDIEEDMTGDLCGTPKGSGHASDRSGSVGGQRELDKQQSNPNGSHVNSTVCNGSISTCSGRGRLYTLHFSDSSDDDVHTDRDVPPVHVIDDDDSDGVPHDYDFRKHSSRGTLGSTMAAGEVDRARNGVVNGYDFTEEEFDEEGEGANIYDGELTSAASCVAHITCPRLSLPWNYHWNLLFVWNTSNVCTLRYY